MTRAHPSRAALAGAILLALGACETGDGQGRANEQIGALIGTVAGIYLGSQFEDATSRQIGTVVGAAAGAYIGASLARQLNARDRALAAQAGNQALDGPEGKTVTWSNPDSGNAGAVAPVGEVRPTTAGDSCRPFEQTIVTQDGRTQFGRGTACRQPDGTWKVIGT